MAMVTMRDRERRMPVNMLVKRSFNAESLLGPHGEMTRSVKQVKWRSLGEAEPWASAPSFWVAEPSLQRQIPSISHSTGSLIPPGVTHGVFCVCAGSRSTPQAAWWGPEWREARMGDEASPSSRCSRKGEEGTQGTVAKAHEQKEAAVPPTLRQVVRAPAGPAPGSALRRAESQRM